MKYKLFLLLAAAHLLTDFYLNFVPALLPIMVDKLDINLALAGLVATGSLLAANLSQPIFGYLFDTRPAQGWLVLPVILSGVLICTSGLAPNYVLFLFLPFAAGIANGIFHPAASTFIYQLYPGNRGTLISLFSSAGALGFALSPAIVAFFLTRWNPASLLLLVVPALVVAYGLRRRDALPSISIIKKDTGVRKSGKPVITGAMTLLTAVMIFRAWGHLALGNYLVFYLEKIGYAYQTAANLLTWFLVLGAVGSIIGGKVSDWVGRKTVIGSTLLLAGLSGSLFLSTSHTLAIIFLMICGFAVHASLPVMVVFSQELMPDNIGLAAGISMGFAWGIGSIGTFLNGVVAYRWDLVTSFWLAVVLLFLGAVLALGLPNTIGKEIENECS